MRTLNWSAGSMVGYQEVSVWQTGSHCGISVVYVGCEVIYLIYFYFVTFPFFKVTSEQKLEKQKSLSDCKECSISVKVSGAGELKKKLSFKNSIVFCRWSNQDDTFEVESNATWLLALLSWLSTETELANTARLWTLESVSDH